MARGATVGKVTALVFCALALWSCESNSGGPATVPLGSDTAGPAPQVDAGPAGGADPGPALGDPGPRVDPGPRPDAGSRPDPGARDIGSIDRLSRACGAALSVSPGTKQIGEICADHNECETGYCYDEWYLGWAGGFRFCTLACNSCPQGSQFACADFNRSEGGQNLTYQCEILQNSCHVAAFGAFDVAGICVPRCSDIGRCNTFFGSAYTECMVPNIRTNSCGTIGVNKVCTVPEP